jgi:stage V sporulation protein B
MLDILKKHALGITDRIKRRDFSGNTGIAIKNSIFQFSTNIIAKIGSLLFTVVLARLLLPEIFGLYSLALSTIVIFAAFSDLGIGSALVKYLSANEKNPKKAGAYVFYIRSLKVKLTFIVALVLLASSFFVAKYYYQKPIFYALVAGSLYLVAINFLGFVTGLFQARNNFKYPLYKEIFFQLVRLILVPLMILYLLSSSKEILIGGIILNLAFCYILSIFFLYPKIKKYNNSNLKKEEQQQVRRFILPLSATALSGVFFGSIDILMLGRFVDSSYLAFYQAAFALLGSVAALIPFAAAFFPLFSRLKKDKLDFALRKSLVLTAILSLFGFIITFFLAPYVIRIVYGSNYETSILFLRILSLLLLIDPFNAIYSGYYISQSKNILLAKILISVTVLNIVLNYIFIVYLFRYSMLHATVGAAIATIASRAMLLIILKFKK